MMDLRRYLMVGLLLFSSVASYAGPLWIDVRSEAEYARDNIPNDLNIPHTDLPKLIGGIVDSKDAEIVLYCRSGNRAGITKAALEGMGYTKVSNAGGIDDARSLRGLLQ